MTIQNFPVALQPIIQGNFLSREFQTGLRSRLGFRDIAKRESFPNGVGETITKTRTGLKAPVDTPLSPATNTNLDNGLTAGGWSVEQYTLSIAMYGDTQDLNMVTSLVAIKSLFLTNAKVNGVQAAQSLDRLSRKALYTAYLSGNTRMRTTLGSAGPSVAVDDITGFQTLLVNGKMTAVSPANPLTVTIGGNGYALIGVASDAVNISTAPGGISGVLTLGGNVSIADGTAGNAVKSSVAPLVLRAGGAATTAAIAGGQLLTMALLLQGVAYLRSNNVPTIRGCYNCYLDDTQLLGLFADNDFKLLFRGAYQSKEYQQGEIIELLGIRFIPTTEAPQQQLGAVSIHRAILCGAEALIEGTYAGMANADIAPANAEIEIIDDIAMVTRAPIDRLAQIIAQSWYWIGGYCVPTDATANPAIIPTASNSNHKRCVVIETA